MSKCEKLSLMAGAAATKFLMTFALYYFQIDTKLSKRFRSYAERIPKRLIP